jgi:hypothetical protein
MTKESSPMMKTHTGNIIEMVGVRHVGDLFMFETPYEEVWSSLPRQILSNDRSSWVVSDTRGWVCDRWPVTYDPNTWRSVGMLWLILWPGEIESRRSQTDLLWGSEGQYTRILRKCIKTYVQNFLGKLLDRKRQRIYSFPTLITFSVCEFWIDYVRGRG